MRCRTSFSRCRSCRCRCPRLWQKTITSKDPLGLLPPYEAELADDAFLKSARQTSGHIWVLIGLNYWQTQNNSHNNLIRGGDEDQRLVVQDLYAQLLHTTSTHATQECCGLPWSTRDHSGHNLLPDGPASGKTIELIRNMIVREHGQDLHLLSAVSPNWLTVGKTIEAERLPTEFGPLSLKVSSDARGWTVHLDHQFWEQPERVILSIPWFYQADQVQVDGKAIRTTAGKIRVPAAARQIRINGRIKPATPMISFDQEVADYRREYRRRYEAFLRTGQNEP